MESLFAPGLYEGEVVLVTGGGTGIGYAVAEEVGRLGAKVVIAGRRTEPLEAATKKLGEQGIESYCRSTDTREPETIAALIDGAVERFGKIDVLINNAGGQFPSPAQHISPNGFAAVVRNNLLGTWNVTHAVANQCFIPQKRGRIVSVTAQVARGFPGMAHTGAARAGVENLTKTLAIEWAQFGIRANAVAPGVIRTSGTDQYAPEMLDEMRRNTPLKRLGRTEEVSHLIVYLGSRQADFITGQSFYIDGGQSLWGHSWPIPDDVPQF